MTSWSDVLVSAEESTGVNHVIDIQDYSDVDRLFRVIARILQFTRKLVKLPFPLLLWQAMSLPSSRTQILLLHKMLQL